MIDATIPKSRLSSEIEESHLEVLQPDTLPKRNSPPQGEAMKCFCRIRACDNKNGNLLNLNRNLQNRRKY